jgi:hypothetical protein
MVIYEINWYNKWDENKKKFNSGGKRVLSWITDVSASKIKRVNKRKEVEYNLKKRHLVAFYRELKPEILEDSEYYKNKWTEKYNKEKVKNRYQEKNK